MSRPRAARPSGPRELLWDQRTLTSLGEGRYRLDIPITGPPAPPTPTSDRTLSRFLHRAWVLHPTSESPQVIGVMAGLSAGSVEPAQRLVVVVSLTSDDAVQRLRDASCGEDLGAALALLSGA